MEDALDLILEILVRISLCIFFLWLDSQQPFIRHIEEEELWLYRYPSVDSIVPKVYLYTIITVLPGILFFVEYAIKQRKEVLINNILAITLAYSLNGVFTSVFKAFVGRPRPNFFYRCFPDGVGMDINSCTGDYKAVMDGRRSFPSGHSSFAFASMFFVSRHLFSLMEVSEAKSGKGYKVVLTVLPILIAILIAISRTCDYHHHYTDVAAGAVLGTVISFTVYNAYYPESKVV